MQVCVVCVHMHVQVSWRPEEGTPELELQMVVNCLMRVLGTKFQFSARAADALNHRTVSLVPPICLLVKDSLKQ